MELKCANTLKLHIGLSKDGCPATEVQFGDGYWNDAQYPSNYNPMTSWFGRPRKEATKIANVDEKCPMEAAHMKPQILICTLQLRNSDLIFESDLNDALDSSDNEAQL